METRSSLRPYAARVLVTLALVGLAVLV